MATYPFMQVDAFTTIPLQGNPCAIVFEADNLDDEAMLQIAREMNLSETSFVKRSEVADFRAQYFTPSGEIPLAGHPTIATVFALVDSGRLTLSGDHTTIKLELTAGVIPVGIRSSHGEIRKITMSQKRPAFRATYSPEEVLPVFGLAPSEALPDAPVQTVSTGTPQLMVPLKGLEALRRAQIDIEAYNRLRQRGDFRSTHLFCLEGVTEAGDTFARHLDSPPDPVEDPFTGSATGGMAAYLWRYGMLEAPAFVAEQGHWMGRPGQAHVEVIGPRENIQTVRVGGSAVTVLKGELAV